MMIRQLLRKIAVIAGVAVMSAALAGGAVWAEGVQGDVEVGPKHKEQCASILSDYCDQAEENGDETIKKLIKLVIGVLSVGIGVLGTIGLIICGYIIMTAKDSEQKVAMAKNRMVEIVIGIVIWALGAAVILLVIPDEEAANYAKEGGVVNVERIK